MARGRIGVQGDEMKPPQVADEILRGDTTAGTEEMLQPRMPVIDGLDMKFATNALADRLVERLVADAQGGGTGRIDVVAIGNHTIGWPLGGDASGFNPRPSD